MGNFAIVGANGRQVDPADYEADLMIGQLSSMDDATVGAIAPALSLRMPGLAPRAQAQGNVRLANLLRNPGITAPPQGTLNVRLAQQFPHVVPQDPGPVGLSSIPFNAAAVAAGGTATIVVQPQSIFKAYKLVLDEVIRPFFLVTSFTIGTVPLFDAPGAMAGTLFTPDALPNLKKITANPGIAVTLQVTNRDGAAHPFFAAVYGEAAPTACG